MLKYPLEKALLAADGNAPSELLYLGLILLLRLNCCTSV